MAETKRLEFFIGLFIILGVVVTAGMIIVFGGQGFVGGSYVVNVEFEHIGDLRKGAPVKFGGVRIGRVSDIRLMPEGTVRVEATIGADRDLRSDAKAHISNSGLVGDTFIEFTSGKSPTYLPTDGSASVQGAGQVSTNEILAQVRDIGTGVLTLVDNLNEIVGEQKFKDDIRKSVSNIAAGTDDARKLFAELNAATADIRKTTSTISEMVVEVREKLVSSDNIARVDAILKNVEEVTASAKNTSDSLNNVLTKVDTLLKDQDQKIRGTIDNVAAISLDVKDKLAAIKMDTGVMRFFTTDDMNKRVDELFMTVKAPVMDLARMLANSSQLDLLSNFNMGQKIANEREKEWKRKGLNTTEKILEEEYKIEQERIRKRQPAPWADILRMIKEREEIENMGAE